MISLDTETTGIDLYHGAKPFLVTTCNSEFSQKYWEWELNPRTRQPIVPKADKQEIQHEIDKAEAIVIQNAKFDVTVMRLLGIENWPWEKTFCTLMASHILASNQPHDLTTMALVYLGVNIKPYEDAVEIACKEAKKIAVQKYPGIRTAKEGAADMPSAKEKTWKYDMWLPRHIAKLEKYEEDHPWWTVTAEYANADSAVTLPLFQRMKAMLEERKLWDIYVERMKVLPIVCKMEQRGITLSKDRLEELHNEYEQESQRANNICTNIAASYNYELSLPKSGINKSLSTFVFDVMKLPVVKQNKTGPGLDKNVIEHYQATLPKNSKPLSFINNLRAKRQRDTAMSYMKGYRKFWIPVHIVDKATGAGWYVLHPSLNPTGTDTLRFSSSNPNEQNISKKEGFNLRYMFGPLPGREWYSLDAQNIELRIPAYEAGEQAMIDLFEQPDVGPYYGSNHLLAAHILHPKLFEACVNDKGEIDGRLFKKKHASTWYQWVKNGNFAVQYGAQKESGTADRAYHVPGGQAIIEKRLGKISDLNRRMIEHAEKYGYVETIPDKNVCPDRGYPLLCTRNRWGGILSTVPLSYHVQGTAMWWMMKAMIRCEELLSGWRQDGFDAWMIMQVHDELVFDMPIDSGNLNRVQHIRQTMELSGDDIGIPTPVSIEHHPDNWSVGLSIPAFAV